MLSENKINTIMPKFDRPMLPAPITVRIKFCKKGNLQFISHLDLQRSFHRILIRSQIPMWYTQGFNPHAKLVFGLPLSVGCESECEYADLRIDRQISCEDIKSQLNANLTDEMYVLDAYIPTSKFSDIAYASYLIDIRPNMLKPTDIESVKNLFDNPIIMTKRSKSGDKEIDITKLISKIKIWENDGHIIINTTLSASGSENLNPEYIVTAIKNELDILSGDPTKESYSITRRKVFFSDMTEFK